MTRKVLKIAKPTTGARILHAGRFPRCNGPIYAQSLRCPSCGWIVEKDMVFNAFGKRKTPGS